MCSNPNLADHPVVHELESLEDIVHAPGVGVDIEGLHVVVEPGGLKERGQGGVRGHVAGMDGGDGGERKKEGRMPICIKTGLCCITPQKLAVRPRNWQEERDKMEKIPEGTDRFESPELNIGTALPVRLTGNSSLLLGQVWLVLQGTRYTVTRLHGYTRHKYR